MEDFKAIDELIQKNWNILAKPGVISVRPGYRSIGTSGWVTSEPAIVVIVDRETAKPQFPPMIDGIAVDVREASASMKLRLQDSKPYTISYRKQ